MSTTKKTWTAIICTVLVMGLASCSSKDSEPPATVSLDKTTVAGNVGDNFTVKVTVAGKGITQIKVTKLFDGVADPGFTPISETVSGAEYNYAGTITPSDVLPGTVLYTFAGCDASGQELDAADLTVTVNLTGEALLLKYDWKLTNRICTWPLIGWDRVDDAKPAELDDVYRFNPDYSWQFDWGSDIPAIPSISCAWKYDDETDEIKLILVRYNFDDVRSDVVGEILKLTSTELWLEVYTESWDLTEEFRYTAIAKSPSFTPNRGADQEEYTSANCNPGSY